MDNKEQLRAEEERGAEVRTFLIADVRGYTRFTQEQGDEAARALAARFAEIAGAAVTDLGGQLVELRGDEALAVFTSARGALRAAVDSQPACERRPSRARPSRWEWASASTRGKLCRSKGDTAARALTLAAGLCAIAEPGQILASETVVSLDRRGDGLRRRIQLGSSTPPVGRSPHGCRCKGRPGLQPAQAACGSRRDLRQAFPNSERGIDLISERVGDYQRNPQLGVLLDQLWVE